jgi:outer membrane protein OmpA-like peptidoglycan-associated protein
MKTLRVVLLLLSFGVLLPGAASAEDRESLDTLRFHPAGSSDGGVILSGVTVGEPWQIDGALWLQFARRPLMFTEDGVNISPAIPGRLSTVLHGGFTIADRIRLDLDLPLVLFQGGIDPRNGQDIASGGAGDIRFTPHFLILHPDRSWLGLALSAPISFPSGREDALLGGSGPTLQPRVHLEKRLAFAGQPLLRFAVAAEVGWRFRQRSKVLNLDTDDEFTFGFGMRWEPGERFRLGTELLFDIGAGDNARSGEWVSWLRVTPDKKKQLDVVGGVAVGVGRGVGTAEGRVFLGIRGRLLPPSRVRPPPVEPHPVLQVESPEIGEQPPSADDDAAFGWGLRLVGRSVVIPSRILFDFDKSVLKKEASGVLDDVVRWFRAHEDGLAMEVAGHCDLRGSHEYNDRLSNERARAVWRYLVEHGLPADRIVSYGYGKRAPLMKPGSGKPDVVHSANRRVEFTILSPDELGRRMDRQSKAATAK